MRQAALSDEGFGAKVAKSQSNVCCVLFVNVAGKRAQASSNFKRLESRLPVAKRSGG